MTAAEKDEPAIAVVADDAAILIAAASDDDEEEEEEAMAAVALAIVFEKSDLNIKNRWRNRDLKLRQRKKRKLIRKNRKQVEQT